MSTDSLTIPLANPIEFGGETITSFVIRPPTSEDVRACQGLNVSRAVRGCRFVSRLIGYPPQVFGLIEDTNPEAALAVWFFLDARMDW